MQFRSQEKAKEVVTEFKTFITKGDVVTLAVAMLIGTAFNAIVSSLGNDVIMPVVALLLGHDSLNSMVWVLRPEFVNEAGQTVAALTMNWGKFLQYIINFFFVALVAFTVLKLVTFFRKAATRAHKTLRGRLYALFFPKKAKAQAQAARLAAEKAAAEQAAAEAEAAVQAAKPSEQDLLIEIRNLLLRLTPVAETDSGSTPAAPLPSGEESINAG